MKTVFCLPDRTHIECDVPGECIVSQRQIDIGLMTLNLTLPSGGTAVVTAACDSKGWSYAGKIPDREALEGLEVIRSWMPREV